MEVPRIPHRLHGPPRLRHPVPARCRPSCGRRWHEGPRDRQRGIRDWLALDHARDGQDRPLRQRRCRFGHGRDQSTVHCRGRQRGRCSGFLAPHCACRFNPFLANYNLITRFFFPGFDFVGRTIFEHFLFVFLLDVIFL
jgi:hypothetical protein